MRTIAVLTAVLALGACSTTQLGTAHADAGKALVAAETAVDAAAVAADVAVKAGLTTKAQDAQIVAVTAKVQADIVLARQAYAASDAATVEQLAAQLLVLAAQLGALHT